MGHTADIQIERMQITKNTELFSKQDKVKSKHV